MNPDFPQIPREELEVRLTALLLGELTTEEAAAVRRAIDQDPELAELHERLRRTIDLVREAAVSPVEQAAAQAPALRLSAERRQRLLQHFRTAASKELASPRRREMPWFVPMSVAAALVALIGSVALLPGFARAKMYGRRTAPSGTASVDHFLRADELSSKNGRGSAPPAWTRESAQRLAQEQEDRKQQGLRVPALTALPEAKDVNGEVLLRELGETETITRTASDNPSVALDIGGIVLPLGGDQANALSGRVITGSTSKPIPTSPAGFGGAGGIGGGGGLGGGSRISGENELSLRSDDIRGGLKSANAEPAVTDFARSMNRTDSPSSQNTNRFIGRYVFITPPSKLDTSGAATPSQDSASAASAPIFGIASQTVSGVPEGESLTVTASSDSAPATASAVPPPPLVSTMSSQSRAQTLRFKEGDVKENAKAAGASALALGDALAFGGLGEFKPKDNLAAGVEEAAANARLQPTAPLADSNGFFLKGGVAEAGIAGPRAGAISEKLGLQGGTSSSESQNPQVTHRNPFELKPVPTDSLQRDFARASVMGLPSNEGTPQEGLARGLAVPLTQGQQAPQTEQPARENWIFRAPSSSQQPALTDKRSEDFNWIGILERSKKTDADADQAALADRGEQNPTTLKMDPVLMSRYGLLRPGLIDSKSNTAATAVAGSSAPSIQQSVVLPQVDAVTTAPDSTRTLLAKKRELEELVRSRDNLSVRTNSEKLDAVLPESKVHIVGPATVEPTETLTPMERIRGRITGQFEKVARILVTDPINTKSANAAAPILSAAQINARGEPLIQTHVEELKSKALFSKVIEKLNLNEAWGRKMGGGEKLKDEETLKLFGNSIDVRSVPNSSQIEIRVKSDKPEEAARIANTIAEVYRDSREERRRKANTEGLNLLNQQLGEQEKKILSTQKDLEQLERESKSQPADVSQPKPAAPASVPQPEIPTRENSFSTFSLNISDVSFKLAAASLEKGVMPEPATVRSEEFINAFDYRDSEPPPGVPIAFAWERARYPFAQNRDLLRFSVKTAAEGRQAGRALNLVLLLDNSGSMERADRVRIVREALRVLAGQLQPQDKLSVIAFARTARLWVDGVAGDQAAQVAEQVSNLTPQGGTNLEDAMNLAYQTALRHYVHGGVNRVVLLTDGAANLGNVSPDALKQKVEAHRKQGIALDCFGIGWEGYNDDLLEVLSRNGDGRYGFINTPEEATTGFAGQLAGALRVAASDVKVQVEFNPKRVTAYRQIGYAKHQLTQEQFRDNTVDAAEIGAAESGNALYVVEVNPRGEGLLAVVRVRYKVPGTVEYHEQEWTVPYTGNAVALEQAGSAMRLAATASAFSEWLVSSPYAAEVTPDRLLAHLSGVPEVYGIDPRPKKLEWMIRQAKSVAGR